MDDAGDGRRGLRPRLTRALAETISREYGMPVGAATTDLGGSANLNLLERGDSGPVVIRVYRSHVGADRVAAIQGTRTHLAAQGVPCVRPIATRQGLAYVRAEGHLVEVEPFVECDATMDRPDRITAALPMLGRLHQALSGFEAGRSGRDIEFANYVDPDGLVTATRRGTRRIRSWQPNPEEVHIAETADELSEAVTAAYQSLGGVPRQLTHGDFWDNNVGFRRGELVLVADFDFMGERSRVDDLALTLYFASHHLDVPLTRTGLRRLADLVDAYDSGLTTKLSGPERASIPVALARQPLWSVAGWVTLLDDQAEARRHIAGHMPALQRGQSILANLARIQDILR